MHRDAELAAGTLSLYVRNNRASQGALRPGDASSGAKPPNLPPPRRPSRFGCIDLGITTACGAAGKHGRACGAQ